ncbi:uncharacterized protein FPRO_02157 [Fusarium proliferatum ET1]|uniref:VOC domain-containing protein n=1 Tax=Fusarium proliferatum (strain ET1) TaxID=1227346 RepID=A0A1L7V0Y4_FUSPR|nr:uncharacterized protein FPRO_02157 [Fusarium proliferatum ET1]CZR31581.1 uncharacterized protein FPRO_02157 [Fusarium proliferatum ET1]
MEEIEYLPEQLEQEQRRRKPAETREVEQQSQREEQRQRQAAEECTSAPHTLGHISLGVHSYEASKAFYNVVLAPLGLKLVYDSMATSSRTPRTLGYGPDPDHELVNLFEYKDTAVPGLGFHVAFNAPTRQAVRDFHRAAVGCGGKSNGEPGLRIHYGMNYYAAFVTDPDGWKLEAVCKSEEQGDRVHN